MTRKTYDGIEKTLGQIDAFLERLGKRYGMFVLDEKFFFSFKKEVPDIDDDGETIYYGSAFCMDEIEISEDYEEKLEYQVPAYNYIVDRFGRVCSLEYDIGYDWNNECLGLKLPGFERTVVA